MELDQIKVLLGGVAYTTEEDGALMLHRFTREQEELCKGFYDYSYRNAFSSAGAYLELETDSRKLELSGTLRSTTVSGFYAFDLLCDGKLYATVSGEILPLGDKRKFRLRFTLPEGEKRLKILFPYSAETRLAALELDEKAFVKPVKRTKTMLIYGDSITQGYYASSPSMTYHAKVSDALDANAIVKGIDGEVFRAELATARDSLSPDCITVAYGTNDWNKVCNADFELNCRGFYENLSRNYPDSAIFAITPLWRADLQTAVKEKPFSHIEDFIREITEPLANVTVLRGFDLLPHNPELFEDKWLHPNDEGFEIYAAGLVDCIRKANSR